MSRHNMDITLGDKTATLTLGYDRPLREVFFQLSRTEPEELFVSNAEAPLTEALERVLGADKEQCELVFEAINPLLNAITVEEIANDEHAQLDFLLNAISLGYSEQARDDVLQKAKSFEDFNRVLNYPPLVLAA